VRREKTAVSNREEVGAMRVRDYHRSTVTFVTWNRKNNARLQVESACTLTDAASGNVEEYLFFASCKSEHTFAKDHLFCDDNYDFCGIFSGDEYAIFRTHATHSSGYREEGLWRDRFQEVRQQVSWTDGVVLPDAAAIVEATLRNEILVGQVEIGGPGHTLHATLEFPVKTMNANDDEVLWQVDTGPVAFPDLDMEVKSSISRLSAAYVAYNAPDFADFVVQGAFQTESTGGEAVDVTHYGRTTSVAAVTRIVSLGR